MAKTYFYERPDGSVFACQEQEAAKVHKKFKQVGVSDGSVFATRVREIEATLAKKKTKFGLLAPTAKNRLYSKLMTEAFNEELERARGHLEEPTRQDISFIGNVSPLQQNLIKSRLRL